MIMKKLSFKILLLFTLLISLTACTDEAELQNRPTFNNFDEESDSEGDRDLTPEVAPTRPSGAIVIKGDHCGCSGSEAITIGASCESFCSGKSSEEETLYFNVNLSTAITLDIYKDVFGWCGQEIIDPITNEPVATGVGCYIETIDEDGGKGSIVFSPGFGDSFSVNIGALVPNKIYRLTLVEMTSGARSTTIQVKRFTERLPDPVGGPLQLMPVSQYTCIVKTTETDPDNGQIFITEANRSHFYFVAETRPEPLVENATVYCHDLVTYGTTPINSPLLEETPASFTAWSKNDPRFFALSPEETAAGEMRIHKLIEESIENQGVSLSETPKIFYPLSWPNGLSVSTDDSAAQQTQGELGYYMAPFIDDSTFKAYCPKKAHYFSSNPLFKAMKEVVAVDTEGLYVAKQDNICDFILVKESLLKKIWFYVEGGQHIQPNDNTITGKQIQFYWPADTASPYIKKSDQKVYTVKRSSELEPTCAANTSLPDTTSTVRSNIPPHDKRIGCVPVLTE